MSYLQQGNERTVTFVKSWLHIVDPVRDHEICVSLTIKFNCRCLVVVCKYTALTHKADYTDCTTR